MNLYVKFCVKLLEDLGFEKIETKDYSFIKMPLADSLRFSIINGASFLNTLVGTTLKGRSEVFIHRAIFQNNSLIYSPGLFGRDINGILCEGNSFYQLYKKFPEIFSGQYKYLLLMKINAGERSNVEEDLFKKFSILHSKNPEVDYYNPNNIILFKIFDRGTNLEPFLEYLVSNFFNKQGYITENQVPWFQQKYNLKGRMINGGIPDFSAFKFSFLNKLAEYGFYSEGMPIEEFGLMFLKAESKPTKVNASYELKLGEVKTSKSSKPQISKQLNQYSEARLADELLGIIPDETIGFQKFGLINFLDGLQFQQKKISDLDNDLRKKDESWIKIYVKIILLSNIEISKVKDYIHMKTKKDTSEITSQDLLKSVIESDDDEFLGMIKNGIHK